MEEPMLALVNRIVRERLAPIQFLNQSADLGVSIVVFS
jgi:hypothetical protein